MTAHGQHSTGTAPAVGGRVTVVILTYNEAIHIRRAVHDVRAWAADVFVVDSHSSDATRSLALEAGAEVFEHTFENYAAQREWALRSLPFRTEWMLFLDADELVSAELKEEIDRVLPTLAENVAGMYLKFRLFWMGKWIRHGGLYPTWILRLVRHRRARCDPRGVNEHLVVEGETGKLGEDLLHVDLRSISEWLAKHNRYSSMEAAEQLRAEHREKDRTFARFFGTQAQRKRWIHQNIWSPLLPPMLRPLIFFCYVYFFRLGFLDGRAGFVYYVLWSFCYRFIIEAKYLALKAQGSETINPVVR